MCSPNGLHECYTVILLAYRHIGLDVSIGNRLQYTFRLLNVCPVRRFKTF